MTSNQMVRPKITPQKSRVDYIQELARYCGVSAPRHVFSPSVELQLILEHFADARDENTALLNLAENLRPGPISEAFGGVEHERPFRAAVGKNGDGK